MTARERKAERQRMQLEQRQKDLEFKNAKRALDLQLRTYRFQGKQDRKDVIQDARALNITSPLEDDQAASAASAKLVSALPWIIGAVVVGGIVIYAAKRRK